MDRRRLAVLLVSALLMFLISAGAVLGVARATQSAQGREWIRAVVERQLAHAVRGQLHLGTLGGSFITDLSIDSLELRDTTDAVVLASGPVRATFDPRDLMDGRLLIRSLVLARPLIALRQDAAGRWNVTETFRRSAAPRRPRRASSFGSIFVLEDVVVQGGVVRLTMPWSPPDSLRGARRDSAIAVALADPAPQTRRDDAGGLARTWAWEAMDLDLPRIRVAYPDSAGLHVQVAHAAAVENDPPLRFRDLAGTIRVLGDSLFVDFPTMRLAESSGRASGKVWWGGGAPARIRVRIAAESLSLADVAWISPSLPERGQGAMVVEIRDVPSLKGGFQYALSAMDVRTFRSRLLGRMTWVIGGPVAVLQDVDLRAAPVDVALLERVNGGPLPYPFAGALTGRLRGRGGPLNRFRVDEAAVLYRDANVPGAITRATASGGLDLLRPAQTAFDGFLLRLDSLDLRTLEAANPDFPPLRGTLAGTVRLDGVWDDVRFRDLELTHRDSTLPPSQFRGSGRVTLREETAYDLELLALPIAFTTMAQSFPDIPLRGDHVGPIRVRGTTSDLTLATDLSGEAGRVEADLRLDAEAPGYRVTGRASVAALDPRVAFADSAMPRGEVTAGLDVALGGDSLANLDGTAVLRVDRSIVEGIRVFSGTARLRFGEGRVRVDTARLETTAVEVSAAGALGLHPGRADTLVVRARVDSLGGVRRLIGAGLADTVAGVLRIESIAHGWIRDFAIDAALEGNRLVLGTNDARVVSGDVHLTGLPSAATGSISLGADTVRAAGFGLTRAFARSTVDGRGRGRVELQVAGASGTLARAQARFASAADSVRVDLDSLVIATELQRWALGAPARLARDGVGFAVDSFVLQGATGARLRVAGRVPRTGDADLAVEATALPVADVAELLQVSGEQRGTINLTARLSGTRATPRLEARAALSDALVEGVRLDSLTVTATAVADAVRFAATLGPTRQPVLSAEGAVPLAFTLEGAGPTPIDAGPLRLTVRSDSVSLRVFDLYTRASIGDPGSFALNLDVGGTWGTPTVNGGLVVRDGNVQVAPLGDVRWRDLNADIGLIGDSIAIRRFSATSRSDGRDGRAAIGGWVSLADRENPRFDVAVRANTFHAYNVRNVADVDLSDSLRIAGSLKAATLSGALTADRAFISIPEVATKSVISLEEFDRFGIVDTTALIDQRLLPSRSSAFIDNLTVRNVPVRMGRDVWLRSEEANINLGGAVSITRSRVGRGRDEGQAQLALTGSLQTVRGTYRLNLGPVQRTFEVERGEIAFFGDPDLNPSIDIAALHTVRQYSKQGSQPDVRVRVNIGGTLLAPTATLSTPDSARVKNADLISYLVTGGPSFEIAAQSSDYYASTAARVLLSSLGSWAGGKAAGGLCDDAVLSTSGADQTQRGLANLGSSILEGVRFNCAKQVGAKAFVRLDAGLCQVSQFVSGGSGGSAAALANSIGVKLDYLMRPTLTLSAGVEPPTSAVLCSQNVNARGFVPTPQQFGLDLFRAWRF
ncbi:MAG: hypothetical protein RL139_706 [Gemmatimonadota bacterium]